MPTIVELQDELSSLVRQVPAFTDSGFSVFDLVDFASKTELQPFPLVGVGYDGCEPVDNSKGNAANAVATGSGSTVLVNFQFTIVIAVQYHYASQDDTKPQALNLLDDVRKLVLGYKGVNARPWRYVGERPDLSASDDGLVFYTQVWQTAVPVVGSLNNP